MLFHKKREGPVPIEEIQQLTAKGLNDRDVIKKLKGEGYSYDSIEKSMLQAVKEGVSEEPRTEQSVQQMQQFQQIPQMGQQDPQSEFSEQLHELGLAELEMPEEPIEPELLVEELVEGVVEDKLHSFKERLDMLEEEISKLYVRVKNTQLPQPVSEEQPNAEEMTARIEDIEARIGGLEKAFKQFLPALTKNIEALSSMIHEMKEKQLA